MENMMECQQTVRYAILVNNLYVATLVMSMWNNT